MRKAGSRFCNASLRVARAALRPGREAWIARSPDAAQHAAKRNGAPLIRGPGGDGLQGGGKNFGCTKCDGGLCRDYSCNGSGKGRQGCYETVIKRTGQQTGKGRASVGPAHPQGQATTSGGRRVPKGSPHPATVNVSGGHGTFHGKPIQGVSGVSPDKQDSKPPFDRHGGGRSSNNRRH